MRSEDRYINASLNKSKYDNDDTTNMGYSESNFKTIAAIAGTIAVGVIGYRRGYFKKGLSEAIDYASKYKVAYPGTAKVFKAWLNAGEDAVVDSGVERSLVRTIKGISLADMFTEKGRANIATTFKKYTPKEFEKNWGATKKDYGMLKERLNDEIHNFKTFNDTEFSRHYASINKAVKQMHKDGASIKQIEIAKRKMSSDLVKKLAESSKKVTEDELKSGHHALQIKDVWSVTPREENGTKSFHLMIDNLNIKMDTQFTDKINAFGNEVYKLDKLGNPVKIFEHEDFMNMRLDSSILVNESRKMVDMRGFKNTFKFFTNSISNDFKVPILGINPFKIFGVDNFGKEEIGFGALRKGTKQAQILGKVGAESTLKDSMFFSDGSVFKFNDKDGLDLVKENMHVLRVYNGEKGSNYVNKELDSIRKMTGLDTRPKELYTRKDGAFKYHYGNFMNKLDIGFNDIDLNDNFGDVGISEKLNPNTYIQKFTNWILKESKIKPFKKNLVDKKIQYNKLFAEGLETNDDILIAANDMVGKKALYGAFKDGTNDEVKNTVKSFFGQFVAGRKNSDKITTATTNTFFLFDRVNSTANVAGIGLSVESTSSTQSILGNMLLKRVLPAYIGYNAYEFVNFISEGEPDENGNRDNITKKLARGIGNIDLGYHKAKDWAGLTEFAKGAANIMPGIDQITDIPGLNLLKLDKTYDELKEDFNTGMTPVRKGRYWDLGVTPFTGSKIDFFQPVIMRRIHADAKFSEVMYGSRKEYFQNSVLPNPLNPLAPIKHFITDKYHFEKKHYKDRPYLETGGLFTDIPVIGQMLDGTIGKILKPTLKMHTEDLQNAQKYLVQSNFLTPSQSGPNTATGGSGSGISTASSGLLFTPTVYKSPGGGTSLVGVPSLPRYGSLNTMIKQNSLKKTTEVMDNLDRMLKPSMGEESIKDQIDSAASQGSLSYGFGSMYNSTADFLGLYGFFGKSITGKADSGKVIDNPSYAFSGSRQFWDSNMGGLGGEISEIFRRFIHKPDDKNNLINPIRNTMACLSPDTEVFTYNGVYKKASELRIGDKVMSKDGKEVFIENIKRFPTDTIVSIKLYGNNLFTLDFSHNHPIYTSEHRFVNAIDIKKGDYVAFPIRKYKETDCINTIDISAFLPKDYEGITDEHIYYGIHSKSSAEIEIAESYQYNIAAMPLPIKQKYKKLYDICKYKRNTNNTSISYKRISRFWDINDFYYLLGVYGAEGSAANKGISFKLSGHVNDKWEFKICSILDKHNVTYSKQRSAVKEKAQNIVSCTPPLLYILQNLCPGHAHDKYFIEELLNHNVPKSSIIQLMSGLVDGDGYYIKSKDNRIRCGLRTVSKRLAYQFRNMSIDCLSIAPVITATYIENKINIHVFLSGELADILASNIGYKIFNYKAKQNRQKQFHSDTHVYIKVKKVVITKKDTYVIGHQVSGDHTYCVSLIATHNTWLPSSNYFTDFQTGDPFKKIPKGELRLPGQAYERLWGLGDPLKLKIGSSFIGKDKQSIVKHLFKQDDIIDPFAQDIVDSGTKLHKQIENNWLRSGFAIDTEGEIKDVEHGILGYYDARIKDDSTPEGEAIVDIKSVNGKKFEEITSKQSIKDEHMKQVNYYLYATGLKKGYVYYVNRDNPEQTYTHSFDYSQEVLRDTFDNLEEARTEARNMIDTGLASRGDLYEPMDRFRILGDTAPYSEEYTNMVTYMSKLSLSDEDKAEVKAIKERVSAVKNPKRLYEYQYKTADLDYKEITIEKVLDKETFFAKGIKTPIKLGGITLKELDSEYNNDKMHERLAETIYEGARIKIGVDKNASERLKSNTIRAIVYSNGKNFNKQLIDEKYAEATDAKDPVSIMARTSSGQRAFGSLWETFAHLDTPFHTKFLNVRSGEENYERNYVYGREYSSWNKPISEYYKPFVVERNIPKNMLNGLFWGALIGGAFGKTPFGSVVGTAVGLGSVAIGKMYATAYEAKNNTTWKPKRVRKKEEINEYMDMLKYIKYKRLFYQYNELAKKDGINVLALVRGKTKEGNDSKTQVRYLEDLKLGVKRDRNLLAETKEYIFNTKYADKLLPVTRTQRFLENLNKYFIDKINYSSEKNKMDFSNVEKGNTRRRYFDDESYIDKLKGIFHGDEEEKETQLHAINKEIEELKQNRQVIPLKNNTKKSGLALMIRSQYLNEMLGKLDAPVMDEELQELITQNAPKYYKDSKKGVDRGLLKQALTKEMNELSEASDSSVNAAKAMMYYEMSEKTMYAYKSGTPVANITAAMPKADREYFRAFVDAPEEERAKILKLAPRYLRRPLESAWGLEVEKQANIVNYFSDKALPDAEWQGWGENVNLDAVKVKMVKKADLNFADNNIWKNDVDMANATGKIPIPKLNVDMDPNRTMTELKSALTPIGFKDLRIEKGIANSDNNIDLNMRFDDTQKYKNEIEEKAKESLIK